MLRPGGGRLRRKQRAMGRLHRLDTVEIDLIVGRVGQAQIRHRPERRHDLALAIEAQPDHALRQPADQRMLQ